MGVELKNGVLRDGSAVGNVKNGVIRKGSATSAGSGTTCGKTKDYSFKGASTVGEAEAVALYHFLVRSIF